MMTDISYDKIVSELTADIKYFSDHQFNTLATKFKNALTVIQTQQQELEKLKEQKHE